MKLNAAAASHLISLSFGSLRSYEHAFMLAAWVLLTTRYICLCVVPHHHTEAAAAEHDRGRRIIIVNALQIQRGISVWQRPERLYSNLVQLTRKFIARSLIHASYFIAARLSRSLVHFFGFINERHKSH
jgi:hypothetical protein